MANGAEVNSHETIQKPRILKVIAVGENRKSFTMAQIRLEGKWLVDAGLIPESMC
jgi:hypothetical protein